MARIVDLRKHGKKATEPPKAEVELLAVPQESELKHEHQKEISSEPAESLKSPPRFQWEAPSFYYNPQKKYLALLIIALMAGAVALLFYDRDTLLAIFLMLSSLVLVLYANKKPGMSKISVDQTGISIDDRLYYYKELKSFWIDYNPHGPKELSLEARKWYLPHIKVSLEKEDPLELRSLMINFVPEMVHEQSLIDFIAKKLGI